MANNNEMQTMLNKIADINKVEGFDPSVFAVEFADLKNGDTRQRLPVVIQMAWFRLLYPKGKIAVKVEPGRECFVATARVYLDYKDPVDSYVAEATASRGKSLDAPSVSPREWAQTAAIGIALRNAGFGLQFNMAGEDCASVAPDEFGAEEGEVPVSANNGSASGETTAKETSYEVVVPPPAPAVELTFEQKYEAALKVPCPLQKFEGKTLGDALSLDPGALKWLATKYSGDPKVSEAAKLICEYAVTQASA